MTDEKKKEFTMRITHANRTQLVVIVYDMLLAYLEDAIKAYEDNDREQFTAGIKSARDCIGEMKSSLDFDYELSKNLFAIYNFADRELSRNMAGFKTDNMERIKSMFSKLRDAYDDISGKDDSEPLMENIQDVYAGLTYGRDNLNENLSGYDKNRGFLV